MHHCLKALFIDWNGTLLNDLSVSYASMAAIFTEYGIAAPTLDEYRHVITSDFLDFYHRRGVPSSTDRPSLNRHRLAFMESHWNDSALMPGALEVLTHAQSLGLIVALVSAEHAPILARRLGQFSIGQYFDHVRPAAWPKERGLREVLAGLSLEPASCIFLDDTAEGITAARTLGMRTIGFTGGYGLPEMIAGAKPDHLISHLRETIPLLRT